jgi:hypothetical protein
VFRFRFLGGCFLFVFCRSIFFVSACFGAAGGLQLIRENMFSERFFNVVVLLLLLPLLLLLLLGKLFSHHRASRPIAKPG